MNVYKKRLDNLREYMKHNKVNMSVVTNPDHQFYLTGFKALIYSRPIILVVGLKASHLVIPGLEEVHAKEEAVVDHLHVYFEDGRNTDEYTDYLKPLETILSKNEGGKIGADFASTPVALERAVRNFGSDVTDVGAEIVRMRYIKENEEIDKIREVSGWINLAVGESLKAARAGVTELEIDDAGNSVLYREVPKKHPEATLQLMGMSPSGPLRSVMPHVFSNSRQLKDGDVMIHTRQVSLNGYRTELERTVFIGEPTYEQKRAFQSMLDAQNAAIEALKPGVKASEVDNAARSVFRKDGYEKYAVHRAGHGIGISPHEEPYIRFDNNLVIEEGMVFTIEPGIYIPEIGGFRHSDTLVVTAEGYEFLTDYPRDLESMIL
ncbi:M24 family metallopeptidase [Evansella clarkii]|uniref:M24 family metallopeptidase n=1 Tax=Evansella clarkii TaxID=79879 RepID=UPI000B431398|nr:Xaa-Pro peptidase family protein [Evansella clarkii]